MAICLHRCALAHAIADVQDDVREQDPWRTDSQVQYKGQGCLDTTQLPRTGTVAHMTGVTLCVRSC